MSHEESLKVNHIVLTSYPLIASQSWKTINHFTKLFKGAFYFAYEF